MREQERNYDHAFKLINLLFKFRWCSQPAHCWNKISQFWQIYYYDCVWWAFSLMRWFCCTQQVIHSYDLDSHFILLILIIIFIWCPSCAIWDTSVPMGFGVLNGNSWILTKTQNFILVGNFEIEIPINDFLVRHCDVILSSNP